MPKFKGSTFQVGDIVKPLPSEDGYLHPHLIAGKNYTVEGYTSDGHVNVSGEFRGDGNGYDWDEDWFELAEEVAVKAQIGDKVRLVNKPIWVGAYKEGDIGVVADQWGAAFGYLLVALDNGIYSIPHGQYEVIENDAETSFPERKEEHRPNKDAPASSAEAIRDNILRIREKRNELKMEIIALNKEEASCIDKLASIGFTLYEQESTSTQTEVVNVNYGTEKTALYADDIEEDMNDPRNWEVGDVIESIDSDIAPIGSLATITKIAGGMLYRSGGEGFTCGGFGVKTKGIWKFHSRPL